MEKSISRSESEDESDSESDSGAEEQLRVRFSVKLSRSLGFTLEWQVLRWHLKEDGEVWVAGQRGQLLEWTTLWMARDLADPKPFPQLLQLNGRVAPCVKVWSLRWSALRNFLPHWRQGKGRSSVWVLSWICRL